MRCPVGTYVISMGMAEEKGCTMGQLSLAWMINKDPRIIRFQRFAQMLLTDLVRKVTYSAIP